ncbi:hypothetical protein, partial [Collimonas pratensis]|uniref:hypothetical protein n=1 Tax=Collimonas pratensis TaxID=279113 RepID=UPI00197EEB36
RPVANNQYYVFFSDIKSLPIWRFCAVQFVIPYQRHTPVDFTLDAMKRAARTVLWFTAGGICLSIAACMHTVSKYQNAFAATAFGDTASVVVERFGSPSVHENNVNRFLRYAAQSCEAPCTERLWWEHPVLKGIEAWSVEFDTKGKAIDKAHWVLP